MARIKTYSKLAQRLYVLFLVLNVFLSAIVMGLSASTTNIFSFSLVAYTVPFILNEFSYFLIYKIGYHALPVSRELDVKQMIQLPQFVRNSSRYIVQRAAISRQAKLLRCFMYLPFSLLGMMWTIFLLSFLEKSSSIILSFLLIVCLFLPVPFFWRMGSGRSKLFERYVSVFTRYFELDILWKEHNRPFFEKYPE